MTSRASTLIAAMLLLTVAGWRLVLAQDQPRRPLRVPKLEKIEHKPTTADRLRVNPQTGEYEQFNPLGTIVPRPDGSFILTWQGLDRTRKEIAWQPRSFVEAVVAAHVEPAGNSFRYLYSLSSLPTSRQLLQTLYVSTEAPITEVTAPDGTWYSQPMTSFVATTLHVDGGWTWSQVSEGRPGLAPGTQQSGFSFVSEGLPYPVKVFAAGHWVTRGIGEDPPDALHAAIAAAEWQLPTGFTVGPSTDLVQLSAADFVSALLQMTDVARDEGWIRSPQLLRRLLRDLSQLRASLVKSDRARAAGAIRQIQDFVEQEKHRALLPEAYALLKINLRFLAARLSLIEGERAPTQ